MLIAASRRVILTLAVATLIASGFAGSGMARATQALTGSVTVSNQSWTCRGAVDLDSVTVVIGTGIQADGIHLERGCTGVIRHIDVTTASQDGLKINEPNDLTIGSGIIRCTGRIGLSHQDGVQALSGTNVRVNNLTVDCPSANNSDFYVNQGHNSANPPTNVVCSGCYLHGTGSSTVFVAAHSVHSGVENSTICPSPLGYRKYAPDAIDVSNTYLSSCADSTAPPPVSTPPPPSGGPAAPPPPPPVSAPPPKPNPGNGGPAAPSATAGTISASARAITYGASVVLQGNVAVSVRGVVTNVQVEKRPAGSSAFEPVAVASIGADGKWMLLVAPRVDTEYRATYAGLSTMATMVQVTPQLTLAVHKHRFTIRVRSATSCTGKRVVIQRRTKSRWKTLKRVVLPRGGVRRGTISLPHGVVRLRAVMLKGRGDPAGATSATLRVRG